MSDIERSEWVWMPHAAHLIVGHDCRFHLATRIGNYIVSTVGEYLPDAPTREILSQSRGVNLEGKGDYRRADYMKKIGFEEIGLDRTYETMVFRAEKHDEGCCPFQQADGTDLDFDGYNEAADAYRGHLAMCEKWASKEVNPDA